MSDIGTPRLVGNSTDQIENVTYDDEVFYNDQGGALAAGDAVKFDLAPAVTAAVLGNAAEKTATTDTANFAGVVVAASDAQGDKVIVRRRGFVPAAAVETGVSAGDPLKVSGTTAGRLDTGTVGTDHIVGFALEAESSNAADVILR